MALFAKGEGHCSCGGLADVSGGSVEAAGAKAAYILCSFEACQSILHAIELPWIDDVT